MVCDIQLCLCNVGFKITLRREFLSPYGPSVDVVALLLLLLLYAPLPSRNMPLLPPTSGLSIHEERVESKNRWRLDYATGNGKGEGKGRRTVFY